MFDFAFGGKAVENAVVEYPENMKRRMDAISTLSNDATLYCTTAALRELIKSFVSRMVLRGDEPEKISVIVGDFINLCYKNGDIQKEECRWLKSTDWYEKMTDHSPYFSRLSYNTFWESKNSILENAMGVRFWNAEWCQELRRGMSKEEVEVLEQFKKTQEEMWKILDKRDKIFLKASRAIVGNLLIKYAEQLEKLDKDLYTYLKDDLTGDAVVQDPPEDKVIADEVAE